MSRESLIDRELEEEFIKATIIIQTNYEELNKHDQIKVEAWIEKLAKSGGSFEAKKNRNIYIKELLKCTMDLKLETPFDKHPAQGILAKFIPKSPANDTGGFAAKHKKERAGKLTRTEEIEKFIETNLMSIKDEEIFDLSPRETFQNKTVKFDTSTIYEITPSKSNRYRGVRESAALGMTHPVPLTSSKRESNKKPTDKTSQLDSKSNTRLKDMNSQDDDPEQDQ